MSSFFWVDSKTILAVHARLIAEFGGSAGLRDYPLLESALGRPVAKHQYEDAGPAECAAAYAFGVAKNHPFHDGNKRAALACAILFLRYNGFALQATDRDARDAVLAGASGKMDESALAAWFIERIREVD